MSAIYRHGLGVYASDRVYLTVIIQERNELYPLIRRWTFCFINHVILFVNCVELMLRN